MTSITLEKGKKSKAQIINLPLNYKQLLESELRKGEKVLWSGLPETSLYSNKGLYAFILSIPWIGISYKLFSESIDKVQEGGPTIIAICSIVLMIIGAWLFVSPIRMWFESKRIVYAVTNERAIIIKKPLNTKMVDSFEHKTHGELHKKERDDGFGDLIFRRERKEEYEGHISYESIGFVSIEDVSEVEKLVREQMNK